LTKRNEIIQRSWQKVSGYIYVTVCI